MDQGELAAMMDALGTLARKADGVTDLDGSLTEFGWLDMLAEEEQPAVRGLFEILGEEAVTSSALSWVVARAAMPDLGLDELRCMAVAVPARGWGAAASESEDATYSVSGLLLPGACATRVLVPVDAGGVVRLVLVDIDALDLVSVRGLDPSMELRHLSGVVGASAVTDAPVADDPATAWVRAVAAGRRALGHQIAGTITAMLDLAIEHSRVREQFGRPIGTYQVLRHKLAEVRCALEVARDGLTASWDADDAHAALCAKALAGRSLREASLHCQQVLAGMGFSDEHAFPGLYKRGVVLDALLGSSVELTRHLGESMAAAGAVFPLPGLAPPVSEPFGLDLHRTQRSWQ